MNDMEHGLTRNIIASLAGVLFLWGALAFGVREYDPYFRMARFGFGVLCALCWFLPVYGLYRALTGKVDGPRTKRGAINVRYIYEIFFESAAVAVGVFACLLLSFFPLLYAIDPVTFWGSQSDSPRPFFILLTAAFWSYPARVFYFGMKSYTAKAAQRDRDEREAHAQRERLKIWERGRPERERAAREAEEEREREASEKQARIETAAEEYALVRQQQEDQAREKAEKLEYMEDLRVEKLELQVAEQMCRLKERTLALELKGIHIQRAMTMEMERQDEHARMLTLKERREHLRVQREEMGLWKDELDLRERQQRLRERQSRMDVSAQRETDRRDEQERMRPFREKMEALTLRKRSLDVEMAEMRAERERNPANPQAERMARKQREIDEAQAEYDAVQAEVNEMRRRAGWDGAAGEEARGITSE